MSLREQRKHFLDHLETSDEEWASGLRLGFCVGVQAALKEIQGPRPYSEAIMLLNCENNELISEMEDELAKLRAHLSEIKEIQPRARQRHRR